MALPAEVLVNHSNEPIKVQIEGACFPSELVKPNALGVQIVRR